MGQLVEVLAVVNEDAATDGPLLGASIDGPASGRRVSARAVEIGGWVLGRNTKPEEVEVALDEAAIARAPVRWPRPDIAEAFPGVEDAADAGYELMLDASRLPAEAEVEVRARVGGAAVPIGSLRLRRRWRDAASGEAPLVAVVVTGEGGEGRLDLTVRSLDEQRYWPTEVLIAGSDRNKALRESRGGLVAFVEAGRTLAPGTLDRAVEILRRHPEAPALLDGVAADAVTGAVYRRSAFEELEGFRDSSGRSCDSELAGRAAALDALFVPGILIAGCGS